MSVHHVYYLRATGRMGGKMMVVVKCRGEEDVTEEGIMMMMNFFVLKNKTKHWDYVPQ